MAKKERTIKAAPTGKDFQGDVKPDWCSGCGDFGVLRSLEMAYAKHGRQNHDFLTISGIGCSSNLPGYINTYGMHTLHGRSLAVATGAKMANHDLTVVVTGGDGDGYAIGGNHFIHTMRRNVDLLYVVMDNQVYGLTIKQVSPTSELGMKTSSTPFGSVESPVNPIALALISGATYVARGFSGDPKHLAELFLRGMEHKGFALVDVFSPCITFNKDNDFQFFKQRVNKLEDMGHDPSDFDAALKQAAKWGDEIPIGLLYQDTDSKSLDALEPVLDEGPLAHRELGVTQEQGATIIRSMM
jgi:2-oxoglutarate ferredoxin oxidoreductase subunit beta